jgi:endonuclease G
MAKRSRRSSGGGSTLWILLLLVAAYFVYQQLEKKPSRNDTKRDKPTTEKQDRPQPRTPESSGRNRESSGRNKKDTESTPTSKTTDLDFAFEKTKDFELPSSSSNYGIVRHEAYTLGYSEKYEQAAWVAYQLTASEVKGTTERENDFRPDPQVVTGSATPEDYRASGYDRGHLAPAADFKSSARFMSESFYMSNMSPQVPEFNRGIWERLESRVRTWVRNDKVLYIVSGPVLKGKLPTIGKRTKVAVPEMYYKIILDLKKPDIKSIAFLLKNEPSSKSLSSFVVSIDEVEKVTGLDFFPSMPDDLEKELEGEIDEKAWFKH